MANFFRKSGNENSGATATIPSDSPLLKLEGTYVLDPSHTLIGFSARHAMVTKVRGSFTDFSGTATTKAGLVEPSIEVHIQTASVTTNEAKRDAHLNSSDFFEVGKYPTIDFVSTDVTATDAATLHVVGDLTIKGVTKSVAIDFDFAGEAQDPFGNVRVGLEGSTTVDRKDFGLTWNAALETGGVLVSDKVTLEFEVSAIKQA